MGSRLNLWLLFLLVLCAVSLWLGQGADIQFLQPDPASDPPDDRPETGLPERPTIHLLILNGTDQRGLAMSVGLQVTRVGCVAENIGNAPSGNHPVSLLVNRRLEPEIAQELAHRLGGVPILLEWDGRGTEDAVLLLGNDFPEVLSALER